MTLDAHQHFWKFDPIRDQWIDDSMQILQRDFLPDELTRLYAQNNIDGCVAVQADQSPAETRFLLDLAAQYPIIKGVVGWVDLRASDLEAQLEAYTTFPALKGFRHIVQGEPDVNFMLRPDFQRGIGLLHQYGFTYDILIFPHQMGAALELVRAYPQQRFVLDHLGKPYIKDGFHTGWATMLRALGQCDNLWCKVSGLVTEADWHHWTDADMAPYLDTAFEVFGPQRLMYGSDWPVSLLGGEYARVKGIVDRYLSRLSETERGLVMGDVGVGFYGLKTSL